MSLPLPHVSLFDKLTCMRVQPPRVSWHLSCNMQVLVRARKGADSGYPITAAAADVWSAGVLLFTIAAKLPPFTSAEGSLRDLTKQHKSWVSLVPCCMVAVQFPFMHCCAHQCRQ